MNSAAEQDQFEAAARDAHRVFLATAVLVPDSTVSCSFARDEDGLPPLVRRVVESMARRLGPGLWPKECPHLSAGPRPGFLAAWDDGVIRCAPCWAEYKPDALDPIEAFTCDLCRRYTPGDINDVMVQAGCLTLSFGSCDDCKKEAA